MSGTSSKPFERLLADLHTLGDELRVKAHLAGKDLQEFVDSQAGQLDELRQRVESAAGEARQHAPEVEAAARTLFSELERAFEAARERLRS